MADNKNLTAGKIVFTLIYILIFPTLLLSLSGDWLWREGWIFSIWFTALCFSTIIHLYRHDPDLLAERYKKPGTGNQKGWDRYVVIGLLIGFIAWIVIMPLDVKRYGWTAYFPLWIKVLGFTALLFSFLFFYRSYAENTFVSALVRIQAERRQHVISTGVYGFVRHPMYLGGILLFIGTPMLLGSMYGLLIGIAMLFLLAGRIIGEEKMLVNELEGYEDYKKKVRYRLLPYIW
ncbi:MAG: isoprenylcysteine carboxylmethyltransferase family protein [Desulfotomaculaceae bacterium]|nr:isoprenylcysteine carboxylmethyltransferase family protein [Desulfotomaculaceae bacterium]